MSTSDPIHTIRPSVVAMAIAMERRLRKHDNARGPTGWNGAEIGELLDHLHREVNELETAVAQADRKPDTGDTTPFRNQLLKDRITSEAADVANMAMMVADTDAELEQEGAAWALVPVPSPEDTGKQDAEPAAAPVGDRVAADDDIENLIRGFQLVRNDALAGKACLDQGEIAAMALLAMDSLEQHGDNSLSNAIEAQISAGSDLVLAVRIALESMRAADQAEDGAAADSAPGVSEFDWSTERRLLFEKAKQVLETAEMRHCRICLCTDEYGCVTGEHTNPETNPCSWAEDDLCSRCAHCIDDGQHTPVPTTPPSQPDPDVKGPENIHVTESFDPTTLPPESDPPEPTTALEPGETLELGSITIMATGDRAILIGLAGEDRITVRAVEPEDAWPGTTVQQLRYETIRGTGHSSAAVEYLLSIWKSKP